MPENVREANRCSVVPSDSVACVYKLRLLLSVFSHHINHLPFAWPYKRSNSPRSSAHAWQECNSYNHKLCEVLTHAGATGRGSRFGLTIRPHLVSKWPQVDFKSPTYSGSKIWYDTLSISIEYETRLDKKATDFPLQVDFRHVKSSQNNRKSYNSKISLLSYSVLIQLVMGGFWHF